MSDTPLGQKLAQRGLRLAPMAASAPLGQTATSYSEVDPKWKPPGE